MDVGGIVHLGCVVPRAGKLGEGQPVLAAVVGDGEEAFLDVDIGRSILAHGAQLDEVRLRCVIAQGKEQVEGADHIVDLGHGGVGEVDHGERCAPLFREMDQGVGLGLLHQLGDGASIA